MFRNTSSGGTCDGGASGDPLAEVAAFRLKWCVGDGDDPSTISSVLLDSPPWLDMASSCGSVCSESESSTASNILCLFDAVLISSL